MAPRRLSRPLLRRISDLVFLLSAFWRFRRRLEDYTRQWERLHNRLLASPEDDGQRRFRNTIWEERNRLWRRGKWLLPRCGLWRRRLQLDLEELLLLERRLRLFTNYWEGHPLGFLEDYYEMESHRPLPQTPLPSDHSADEAEPTSDGESSGA